MPKKKSFVLYHDYFNHIYRLSDEEAGRLFKALFAYVNDEPLPELSSGAEMAFSFIRCQVERDCEKYEEKCRRMQELALKREEKRREKSASSY